MGDKWKQCQQGQDCLQSVLRRVPLIADKVFKHLDLQDVKNVQVCSKTLQDIVNNYAWKKSNALVRVFLGLSQREKVYFVQDDLHVPFKLDNHRDLLLQPVLMWSFKDEDYILTVGYLMDPEGGKRQELYVRRSQILDASININLDGRMHFKKCHVTPNLVILEYYEPLKGLWIFAFNLNDLTFFAWQKIAYNDYTHARILLDILDNSFVGKLKDGNVFVSSLKKKDGKTNRFQMKTFEVPNLSKYVELFKCHGQKCMFVSISKHQCYSISIEEGLNVEEIKISQVTNHDHEYILIGINDSFEVLKKTIKETKQEAYFLRKRNTKEVSELIQYNNFQSEWVDIVSDSNNDKQVILIQRDTNVPDIIDLNLFLIKGGKVHNRLAQTISEKFNRRICPILNGNFVIFSNIADIHCFDMKSGKYIHLNQLSSSRMICAANCQEELDGFVIWRREEQTNEAGKMFKLKSFKV